MCLDSVAVVQRVSLTERANVVSSCHQFATWPEIQIVKSGISVSYLTVSLAEGAMAGHQPLVERYSGQVMTSPENLMSTAVTY